MQAGDKCSRMVSLLVTGGRTCLLRSRDHWQFRSYHNRSAAWGRYHLASLPSCMGRQQHSCHSPLQLFVIYSIIGYVLVTGPLRPCTLKMPVSSGVVNAPLREKQTKNVDSQHAAGAR